MNSTNTHSHPRIAHTNLPSSLPSALPSMQPSCVPSGQPSVVPSVQQTVVDAGFATIQPTNQCWILPTSTSVPSGRNSCNSACVCWVGGWPILLTVSSPCYTFHLLTHTVQYSSCTTTPTLTPSTHYPRAQACPWSLLVPVFHGPHIAPPSPPVWIPLRA